MNKEQRFVGRSRREVFAKVRQALGPDAVIVDQRVGDGCVEIIASEDFPGPAVSAPLPEVFADRLRGLGFDGEFIGQFGGQIGSWNELSRALPDVLDCGTPPVPLRGVYRFVGAPGVGKTTAVVKLLAESVLRIGASSCALVTTDTNRLAGCEPLALATQLLDVDYREVSESDLQRTLTSLADKALVLVDSAGISPGGKPPAVVDSAQDIFVVPAMWQASALLNSRRQLGDATPAAALLTHVDQADTLGASFSVLARLRLPLWWISRGGDLANDLEPATPDLVQALMLHGIDRLQMSATFA